MTGPSTDSKWANPDPNWLEPRSERPDTDPVYKVQSKLRGLLVQAEYHSRLRVPPRTFVWHAECRN